MQKILSFVRFLILLGLLLALVGPGAAPAAAQTASPQVLVLTYSGPVTPAMVEYLRRGIRTAEQRGAEALILELDTPGGSISLTNSIVQIVRASTVPVVVYVAPRGAMAASAGTLITLAGHAAAMAPETTIGAASPVGASGEDLGETMEAKSKNILKATVRSLAERRGPQALELAEQTVETAQAASAGEALEVGLVDFIASDLSDLLRQMDGYRVEVAETQRTLNTADAQIVSLAPSFIERLLATLTDPNIVLLLMNIGILAVLIELSSPGGWVAGFIGVVCLLLATYGLGVLDVNWFGVIFLIVAFVLFILDIKAPTHGALTAAAVGSLIVGALVLFNSPSVPSFQRVSVPLVVTTSLGTGALFIGILAVALKAQKTPIRSGQESLVGKVGTLRGDLSRHGIAQVAGEQWSAELLPGEQPLSHGTRVEVVAVKGIRLVVRKADSAQK